MKKCPECNGQGSWSETAPDDNMTIDTVICPNCGGTGELRSLVATKDKVK